MNLVQRQCVAALLVLFLPFAWYFFSLLYQASYNSAPTSASSPEYFQTTEPPLSTSPVAIDPIYAAPIWTAPSTSSHTDTIKPSASAPITPLVVKSIPFENVSFSSLALYALCAFLLWSRCADDSRHKHEEQQKGQKEHNKKVETFMLEISKQIPQQIDSLRDYLAALHFSTQNQPSAQLSLIDSKVDRLRHDFCVQEHKKRRSRPQTPSPAPARPLDRDSSDDESSDDQFSNDKYTITMLNKLSHNTASSCPDTREEQKDTLEDSQTLVEETPLVAKANDSVQEDSGTPSASSDPPREDILSATQNSDLSGEVEENEDDCSSVELQLEEDDDDDDRSVDIETEALESDTTAVALSQPSVSYTALEASNSDTPGLDDTHQAASTEQLERRLVEQPVEQSKGDAEKVEDVQKETCSSPVEQRVEQHTMPESLSDLTTVVSSDIDEITSIGTVKQQIQQNVEQQVEQSVSDADTAEDVQEHAVTSSGDEQLANQAEAQQAETLGAHAELQTETGWEAQPEEEVHDTMEVQQSEDVPQIFSPDPVIIGCLIQVFNTHGKELRIENRLWQLRDTVCDRLYEDLTFDIETIRDEVLAGAIRTQEYLLKRLNENLDMLVAAELQIANSIAEREKEALRDREEELRQERKKMQLTAEAYLKRIGTRKDAFPLLVQELNGIFEWVADGRIASDAQLRSAVAMHEAALLRAEAAIQPIPQPQIAVMEQHGPVQSAPEVGEQVQPTQPASADDVRDSNEQPQGLPSVSQEPAIPEPTPAPPTPAQEVRERPSSTFQWPDPIEWDAKGAKAEYYEQLLAKQKCTQRGKIIKRSGAEMESQLSLQGLYEINASKDDREAMQDARAEMGQDIEDAQVFILDDPDREMAGNSLAQYSWDEEREAEWAGSMF